MNFLLIILSLILIQLIYFKLATKYNIIDKPNERSSHSKITLRGGGIIFLFAILFAFFLRYISWQITLSILLIGIISFIDDIKTLSIIPRFLGQIISVLLIFYSLHIFEAPIWLILIIFFFFIGWINIFNFMDGINGIMILYSIVSIFSLYMISNSLQDKNTLIIVGISALIFAFFNVRIKAKAFSGDVGSISMSIFLGYFMLKNIFEYQNLIYLSFFFVYGIDAGYTIFQRLYKKENIFKPHRTHLYQYLANELKISHIKISFFYSFIQLIINLLTIYYIKNYTISIIFPLILFIISLLIYIIIKFLVIKKIK